MWELLRTPAILIAAVAPLGLGTATSPGFTASLLLAVSAESRQLPQGALLGARRALAEGRTDDALAELERLTERYPDSAGTVLLLGHAWLAKGDPVAATRAYLRALDLRPNFAQALISLGDIHMESGNLEEADRYYARTIEAAPNLPMAYRRAVAVDVALLRDGAAVEHLQRYLELQGEDVEALSILGIQQYLNEDRDGAIETLEQVLQIDPDNTKAHYGLGTVFSDRPADYSRALEHLRLAIAGDETNYTAYYLMGKVLAADGELEQAIDALKRVVELSPNFTDAYYRIAQVYARLGDRESAGAHQQRFEELQREEEASDLRIRRFLALKNAASAALASGDFPAFREAMQQFIEAYPTDPEVFILAARGSLATDTVDPGIEALSRILSGRSARWDVLYYHGLLLQRAGRLPEARDKLRQALEKNTTFGDAYAALGNVLMDLDELGAAVEAYLTAVSLDRENAAFHLSLAGAYGRLGLTELEAEAMATYQRLMAKGGTLVSAQANQAPASSGHQRMVTLLAEIGRSKPQGFLTQKRVEGAWRDLTAGAVGASPFDRAALLIRAGALQIQTDVRLGIERLEQVTELLAALSEQERSLLQPRIDFWIGVGYLREAMTANCVDLRLDSGCILAIGQAGVHGEPAAAEAALDHLEPALRNTARGTSLHVASRWLANIAYRATGRYSGDIPAGLAITPALFATAEGFPRFENVAASAMLDTFDYAGGAIVDDFDNDGFLDVITSTMDPNGQVRFFRSRGDGSFEELTARANLVGIVGGLNINQTDYDNDGDLDILVLRGAWLDADGRYPNSLLRNNGDLTFTDVTFEAGLGEVHYPTQTAAWGDYDNDGDLDLFVGNEWTASQPSPSQLFRNNGDGTFTDVAREAGVLNLRRTKGVAWGDYDGDRFPDLYVSNLGDDNRLYRNNRDGTFSDVAAALGVTAPTSGFSTWFWDVNNDGALDLLVNDYGLPAGPGLPVSFAAASIMGQTQATNIPALYLGDGSGGFEEAAKKYGIDRLTLPMGSNFGDLDNDGHLDFFLGTGDPSYETLLPNLMYRNVGGERFVNVTYAGGFGHLAKGHAVSFADIDNDGDQDIFQQLGGFYVEDAYFNALYENPGFGGHWLTIKLVGTESNRAAIGARIRIEVVEGGQRRSIYRHIGSGSSFGANPLRAEIGLGEAARVDLLEVYWPTTGQTQTFRDVAADQFIRITEGDARIEVLQPGSFRIGGAGR